MISAPDITCPRCQSRRVILGEVTRGRTIGVAESFGFRAYAARFSSMRRGVNVSPGMCACAECGLLWGEVKADLLIAHLRHLPTDEVEAWLDRMPQTPI
jgi:hypothetical protein